MVTELDAKYPDQNKTYYASWRPDEASIVFNTNGGTRVTGWTETTGFESGDGELLPNGANAPTKTGYTFDGWYLSNGTTDANGDGSVNDADWGDMQATYPRYFPIGTTTYYAKWKANPATIQFDLGNGDIRTLDGSNEHFTGMDVTTGYTTNVDGNEVVDLSLANFSELYKDANAGYAPDGWYTNANFEPMYAATELPATYPAGTTTYYLKWKALPAYIEFDTAMTAGNTTPSADYGVSGEPITTMTGTTGQELGSTVPVTWRDGWTLTDWRVENDKNQEFNLTKNDDGTWTFPQSTWPAPRS